MWALYLFLGIICGALTAVIITLLFEKYSKNKAKPAENVQNNKAENESNLDLNNEDTSVSDVLQENGQEEREAVEIIQDYQAAEPEEDDDSAELLELTEEEVLTDADVAEILSEDDKESDEEGGDAVNDDRANIISTIEKQVADGGEMLIDEEAKQILAEVAAQLQTFVEAKKAGTEVTVPSLTFTLSREDVLDYIEDMAKQENKFPVTPNAKQKSKKYYCDTLYCGEWCFGLMFERSNVIKFTLRMDEVFAPEVDKNHTAFKKALFPKGAGWYDLVVDSSFVNKKEVYEIIDACYDYVFKRYYRKEEEKFVTDTAAAKTDVQDVLTEVKDHALTADPAFDLAIAEREDALKKFRAKNRITFKMTRKRMLIFAKNNKELKDGGVVIERQKRYMPASLKIKDKTYALVYEKAYKEKSDDGSETVKTYVSLTVRITDTYAEWLALRHPEVCRARFPKNRNWYVVPVDGSFPNAQMIYRVLKRAKKFVTK